jgi:hypothetical protein
LDWAEGPFSPEELEQQQMTRTHLLVGTGKSIVIEEMGASVPVRK